MHIRNTKAWLSTAILLTAMVAAAAAYGEGNPLIGDVANGTRLYRANCTVCHGFTGAGDGPGRATLKTPPADHRDGSLMNARDDRMLFSTVQHGCSKRGCSKTMPGFSGTLGALDTWDLVAYLRSLHMPLVAFFPKVDHYVVKRYHLTKLGNDDFKFGQKRRIKKRAGKVTDADLKQTVFTLFGSESQRASPALIPQQPRELARLRKEDKIGFVVFMDIQGPRKRKVPVGIGLDVNYTITKLVTTLNDPGLAGEYNRRLEAYVGMGKRGDKPDFKTGKDKLSRIFDKAVQKAYVLAVEGANCYELEERERSWADDTF